MNGILLAGYLSLFAADASTTHIALASGQAHEAILLQSPTADDALIGGTAAFVWFASAKIHNPWLRWSLRFGVGSVHGYAAIHNMQAIRR